MADPLARALGPEPETPDLEYDLAVEAVDELRHGPIEESLRLR